MSNFLERFEFRNIRPEEAEQTVLIEQICFPPNEACSEKNMRERVKRAPELFLVAIDKATGKIAGFLNGLSTDEEIFRDEFFTDPSLYDPNGKNIMLLGLDVLPEYRMQGLATEIMRQYRCREQAKKRHKLLLTCLDSKVEMYKKMGFQDEGIANSTWGGEEWHEMSLLLNVCKEENKMNDARINRVVDALKDMGLSQMLITDPLSIYYLTNVHVHPGERFYALYLRADGKHSFFLNKLFTIPEDVELEKVWYEDTDNLTAIIAAHLDKEAVLGVDKDMKARFMLPLMEAGAAAGFKNGSMAVDMTRAAKDEEEREKMRVASCMNDAAMAEFKKLIRAGVTEKEVESKLLEIYKDLGADGFSFTPIVSFGANAADPHHSPDNTVLKEGDCVLFDVGCLKGGYCADMTRTFYYKSVSEEHRFIYETVRKANEAAEAIIKPGVKLCDVDMTARNLIAEAGYGPNFTHRLGHFIGLDVHEFGDVSSVSPLVATPGMVFSIEPGIYLAGNTGVRIEDLVLVTEDGCEILNRFSKELEILK